MLVLPPSSLVTLGQVTCPVFPSNPPFHMQILCFHNQNTINIVFSLFIGVELTNKNCPDLRNNALGFFIGKIGIQRARDKMEVLVTWPCIRLAVGGLRCWLRTLTPVPITQSDAVVGSSGFANAKFPSFPWSGAAWLAGGGKGPTVLGSGSLPC